MTDPTRARPGVEEELVAADDRVIGVAFRWSLGVVVVAGALAAGAWLLWRERPEPEVIIERGPIEAPARLDQRDAQMPRVAFTDITAEAGIDFTHESGAAGRKLLPETMGGGCAFLDADSDGDQDLLLVNSMAWPESAQGGPPATSALYRNDGTGRFEDVTAGSGLDVTCYGMGVACGDMDNDGLVDVYLTALGPNRLLRNVGGRFEDVTAAAGVAGAGDAWSTSAGFFDADNDGDLDLFVCNYVQWTAALDLQLNFTLNGRDRAYGPPKQYQGADCYLFRNEGDGTFTDVSAASGIQVHNPATGQPMGKALAVSFVDIDGDRFLDILVANDTVQNFLFRNLGDGTFEDVGAMSGVAFDMQGQSTGAMGIDVGEFGNDGRLGIGIGNFANESTSFYVQQPRDAWVFADMAGSEGIGSPSKLKLSFGLFFFDYDLDGRLDLLQANGHLEEAISEIQASQTYRQPAQLFWNCGPEARSCFAAVPEEQAGDLARPIVGRGATFADVDADGDLDVLLTQTGGSPLLLRNDQALGHHWLRVRLVGATCNRDAIGAWIEIETDGADLRRQVMPTRSYLSQVELTVTFGLGAAAQVGVVRVHWPDGETTEVIEPGVDRVLVIEQETLTGDGIDSDEQAPAPAGDPGSARAQRDPHAGAA